MTNPSLSPTPRRFNGNYCRIYLPSQEIDALIRDFYARFRGKGAVRRLQVRTGWSGNAIQGRAGELGLVIPRPVDVREWMPGELDILELDGTAVTYQTIQRRLVEAGFPRRTMGSIQAKMNRMRLTRKWGRVGCWNQTELADLLGMTRSTLRSLTEAGKIRGERHVLDERFNSRDDQAYLYQGAEVRRFIIEHIEAIHLERVDKYWLIEVLTGRLGKKDAQIGNPTVGSHS
jgi:hypothetical protein